MKKITLILLNFWLISCQYGPYGAPVGVPTNRKIYSGEALLGSHEYFKKPAPIIDGKPVKAASKDLIQGYIDGCTTGTASITHNFNKVFLKNIKIDGWKFADPKSTYQSGWNWGWWICYRMEYSQAEAGALGILAK